MNFSRRWVSCLIALALGLAPLQTTAQAFAPLIPAQDEEWDWILLDTGEWLKGELRVMYEEELEFDSDYFGILTIDWDEVVEVRTSRSQTIRTEDRRTIAGNISVKKDAIEVTSGDKTETFARSEVISIASGQPKEANYWTAKVSVGANIRSGNVDQVDYNAKATLQRRTAVTRFYWDYAGNYSFSEDTDIADNHRTNSYFDYFFSHRFFIRPLSAEFYRDPFQNISRRETYSSSLGYSIIQRPKLNIDITGGPSWQTVKYVNVEAGEDASQSSKGAIITTTVDWEITKWLDFIGTYRAQWASDEAGGITTHSDSTFEFEVTRNIDVNFSFIWDRTQNPVADEQGVVPEQDDFKIIFGVGLDL
jgi:hypothetical protein